MLPDIEPNPNVIVQKVNVDAFYERFSRWYNGFSKDVLTAIRKHLNDDTVSVVIMPDITAQMAVYGCDAFIIFGSQKELNRFKLKHPIFVRENFK